MLVRFVELANSPEVTVMAAEFTANVVHAMEMEHMSGMDRPRFASNASANAHTAGAIPRGPPRAHFCTASTASLSTRMDACGDGHAHDGAGARESGGEDDTRAVAQHEQLGVSASDDEASVAASGASDEIAGLPTESLVSPTISPRRTLQDRVTVEGRRAHVKDGGVLSEAIDQTATTSTSDGERMRIVRTPITQADLDRNTQLRITHSPASANRTAPSPRLGGGRSAGATAAENTGNAEVSRRSAPSSPTGRRDSLRASGSDTASFARDEPLGCRARSSSESRSNSARDGNRTLGQFDEDIQAGIGLTETIVGREARSGEEGAGLSGSGATADPPVPAEYRRDGRHLLPRFTTENLASVLRGTPVGLEDQFEAPDQNTLEIVLSRAAMRFREDSGGGDGGLLRRDNGVQSANELSLACAGDDARDSARRPGGDGEAIVTTHAQPQIRHSIKAVGFRGWIQVMFAFVLLYLAGDGLRYRLFGGRKTASNISSSLQSGRSLSDEGGRTEAETRFRAVFLPSTCRDASTGAAMAIWVTPGGPCLAPEGASGNAGNVGPACAASFRMCSEAEAGRS